MFPRLPVVFTRQLEILVTGLQLSRSLRAGIPFVDCAARFCQAWHFSKFLKVSAKGFR